MEFGSGYSHEEIKEMGETELQRLDNSPTDRPRFIKTHLPLHLLRHRESSVDGPVKSPVKIIYVTRNPKDVVVSFYNFYGKMLNFVEGSFEQFVRDFMEDKQVL